MRTDILFKGGMEMSWENLPTYILMIAVGIFIGALLLFMLAAFVQGRIFDGLLLLVAALGASSLIFILLDLLV